MKNFCYPGNASNFLRKGITLSLLMLLNFATYSNSVDKKSERKTGYKFLSEKPAFPSFDHTLKNNPPEEASNAARTVAYSSATNPTASGRRGTITGADKTHTEIQAGAEAACTYTLGSNTRRVPATSGSRNVKVTTGNDCKWTVTVAEEALTWLTIITRPAGGANEYEGTINIVYSYETNPGSTERVGIITLGGQTHTVTQEGATAASECSYTLFPMEANIGSAASTAETRGSFKVFVRGTNCTWNPARTPASDWITDVTKGEKANDDSWPVTYSYSANTSNVERKGGITINGTLYEVTQAGTRAATDCSYRLDPNSAGIGAAASTAETSGRFSVFVQGTNCTWNPAPTPGSDWITDVTKGEKANDNGSWPVTYTYTANTSNVERKGGITINGTLYEVTQAGTRAATDCSYRLDPNSAGIGAAASTAETSGRFSVFVQGTNCTWNPAPTPGSDWITDVAKGEKANDNGSWPVTYTYTANTSNVERKGGITINGTLYEVTQAGTRAATDCSYRLDPNSAGIGAAASTAETSGRFSVFVQGTNCTWNPAPTPGSDWITDVAKGEKANDNGSWPVTYTYTANTSNVERKGGITINGTLYEVTQAGTRAATDCSYRLDPNSAGIGAAASTAETSGRFSVFVQGTNCTWNPAPTPGSDWITDVTKGEKANDNGSWPVTYTYTANTSNVERKGGITINGTLYEVTQAGTRAATDCSYRLDPNSAGIGAAASTAETSGRFSVFVQGTNCTWNPAPTPGSDWITDVTKGEKANDNGSWPVTYTYTANTSNVERKGGITINGTLYEVTQAGTRAATDCSYRLDPNSAGIGAAASTAETSGRFSVFVQGTNCTWNPAPTPGSDWITDVAKGEKANDNGSWPVTYTYTANTSNVERKGGITINGTLYEVTQAGTRAATDCSYRLDPNSAGIGAAASTAETSGRFSVFVQGTNCTWNSAPTPGSDWITDVAKGEKANDNGSWPVTYTYTANTSNVERKGGITINGTLYEVTQAGTRAATDCSYRLDPNSAGIGAAASTAETSGRFSVFVQGTNCTWNPAPTPGSDWITDVAKGEKANDNGSWPVTYTYTANTSNVERKGGITINGTLYEVTQAGTRAATDCSYRLDPNSAGIGAAASTAETSGRFSVFVQGTNCTWNPAPTPGSDWITDVAKGEKANDNGSWPVTYTYTANTSNVERKGGITINGTLYEVTQAGTRAATDCSYRLDPNSAGIGAAASTAETSGRFSVFVQGTNCTWNPAPTPGSDWITDVTKGEKANDNGSWPVTYTYTANTSNVERKGGITINGTLYEVTQAGTRAATDCSYRLDPNSAGIGAAASTAETSGRFSVFVQGTNCTWNPAPTPGSDWITDVAKGEKANDNGSWPVTYTYTANTSNVERKGGITINGTLYEVTQAGTRAATDCSYRLDPNSAGIGAAASTAETSGRFSVFVQGTNCTWNPAPTPGSDWITDVTKGEKANDNGSWPVTYTYTANTSNVERKGGITINGTLYEVTQAGTRAATDCSYRLDPNSAGIGAAASTAETSGRFSVFVQGTNCTWNPAPTPGSDWITDVAKGEKANDNGSWPVTYTYTANTSNVERKGGITINGTLYEVTQAGTRAATDCSYRLDPNSAGIGAAASTAETSGRFSVFVQGTNCTWNPAPTPGSDWITDVTKGEKANDNGSWPVTYTYTANTSNVERKGGITINGTLYEVTQAGTRAATDCSYRLDPNSAGIGAAASTAETSGRFSVFVQGTNCTWNPAPTPGSDWITDVTKGEKANDNGSWPVTYTYTANTSNVERKGGITINGTLYEVTQAGTRAATDCSYRLDPNSAGIGAAASTAETSGRFSVFVQGTNCTWNPAPTPGSDWITDVAKGEKANDNGSWPVTYTYTANTSNVERKGGITINGTLYEVTQAGTRAATDCSYRLDPNSAGIGAAASTAETSGRFSVFVQGTNCTWNPAPTPGSDWITDVAKGEKANDDGSWTVTYSYTANTTNAVRNGTIRVGETEYRVVQAVPSCYTFNPPQGNVGADASTTGSFTFTVQGTGCSLETSSGSDWITDVRKAAAANADGSWTVTYSYTANTNPTVRRGSIRVGDKTHAVKQAGTATTPSCSYTLPSAEVSIGSDESTTETKRSFTVTVQGSGCSWKPEPNNVWINNVSKATTANADGSWTVTYTHMANTGRDERIGTITVGDENYTVKQAGGARCDISLYRNTGSVPAETGSSAFLILANDQVCEWTATVAEEDATWLYIDEGQQRNGIFDLWYTFETNPNTTPRTGRIIVSGHTYTVTQEAACSYTLSPALANVGSAASTTGSFVVTKQGTDCMWAPERRADWITGATKAAAANADGSWTVTYSYTANTTTAVRNGIIRVGDSDHTVTQAPPCSYTFNPPQANVGAAASTTGSFAVTVQGTDCAWNPAPRSDWITGATKAAAANADGSWTVTYSYTANTTNAVRNGTIRVGDTDYTVTQAVPPCSYTFTPPEANVVAAASTTGSFAVTVQGTDCAWNPVPQSDWITGATKAAAANTDGSWTVTYSYTANTTNAVRNGTIRVGDTDYTVTQAGTGTPSCFYTMDPIEVNIGVAASTEETKGSFTVTVQGTECSATPTTTTNWITEIKTLPPGANGVWTVTYSYLANTSAFARSGSIIVADKIHTVMQAGTASCLYTLTPTEGNAGLAASTAETTGSFVVTVQGSTACSWTPSTTSDWITRVTKAENANADGTWTVTYSWLENTNPAERRGTITVADKSYTVIQAGTAVNCFYTLAPGQARVGVAASTAEKTGSFTVNVQGTDCSWTASTTADWITNVSKAAAANANGSWTVTYSYTANTAGSERRGTITVGDKTHTVIQAGVACSFTLSSNTAGVPATAGKGSISVVTGANCSWTAESKAAWITIPAGQTLTGSMDLSYSYEENPSPTTRIGIITVAGHTLTVTQSALVTGVEPISQVNIFPNPAKGFVTVDLSAGMKCVSLKIVNLPGEILYKLDAPPAQALQIPLHGFACGLYFIILQGEDKISVKKLLVE